MSELNQYSVERLRDRVLVSLDEIKGREIKVIDVRGKTSITDYMIVVTGTSGRHVKSVAEHVAAGARAIGVTPLGIEGEGSAEWVLVDLGDVIVHVMQLEARDFYNLEKLWEAPPDDAMLSSVGRG